LDHGRGGWSAGVPELDRYVREVSEYRLPILGRVPQGATVLDVGAWTGAHGHWLAERRGATVDGVELNADAAAEARGYREMVVGSIEDPALRERVGSGYDAILFLDVLEHLVYPEKVLRAVRRWLAPGGVVLCSIPNVAHWRVRLALLRGRFDYEDSGLLDRTHQRWYTRRTAQELVREAGYELTWEDAVVPQHPRVSVPQRLLHPELFAYQFLIEGRSAGVPE
jgi:2-polyprenyl-3-methyl-5-hydroxy-6-metoxy-1,4-benzoquinol methylase